MTERTKQLLLLLLHDLCSRLPYRVIVKDRNGVHELTIGNTELADLFNGKCNIRPYLRPLSSMTEEEKKELERLIDEKLNRNVEQEDNEWTPWVLHDTTGIRNCVGGERFYFDEMSLIYKWLYAHHFDVDNLIPAGLAIEVTKENNPYKD